MSEIVIPSNIRFFTAANVAKKLITKANESTIGDLNFEDFEVTVNREAKTFLFALTESAVKDKYVAEHQQITFTYERATLADILQHVGFKPQMGPVTNKQAVIDALPQGLTHEWAEESRTLTVKVAPETAKFGFTSEDMVSVTTFLSTEETFEITFEAVSEEEKVDLNNILTVTNLNLTVEDIIVKAEAHGA